MTLLFTLIGAAQAAPDLVAEIVSAGCTGAGGDPTVVVRVRNTGNSSAGAFYLDVFRGLPAAPEIGEYGEDYHRFTGLAAGASALWSFTFPGEEAWVGWVDVLVDTDELVLEANETNNVGSRYLALPDCSFN